MAVPYTFGSATSAIPLSQLDSNFATTITLGNTAIQLGNTVTTLNNMTLANVTISSGNVTITNVSVTTANVTTLNAATVIATTGNITTVNATTVVATTANATTANITTGNLTDLNLTNNPTFSGGTANGVLYLNASKVATSGSALTFDGTTLKVKGGNAAQLYLDNGGQQYTQLAFYNNGIAKAYLNYDNTNSILDTYTNAGINLTWSPSGTEGMRLTSKGLLVGYTSDASLSSTGNAIFSGSVGIGTSAPTEKLDVKGTVQSNTASGTIPRFTLAQTGIGTWYMQMPASTNAFTIVDPFTSERFRIDSSGNVGLGVTPSAWGSGYKAYQNLKSSWFSTSSRDANFGTNVYVDAVGYKYIDTAAASLYTQYQGAHSWFYAASGTAGNAISFTQAMTLDASGNLLVGSTTNTSGLKLLASDGTVSTGFLPYGGGSIAYTGTWTNHTFGFAINGNERARITSGGYFKASDNGDYQVATGTYHEFSSTSSDNLIKFRNTNATPYGADIYYSGAAPNGTGNTFLYCHDTGAVRASIRSNGGLANYQSNNVDLSDIRTKKDIKPVASYWNKIAAIEIVSFKYKDQTDDVDNIGVIAQQVESVAPEFVDDSGFGDTPDDGVPLKTIYNKDVTFAAIKALQEAMARIEQLEAKVAALEGN